MERSIYSAFVNIYPNKHEDNEIEENNNEIEYLRRKDQISIFTQPC